MIRVTVEIPGSPPVVMLLPGDRLPPIDARARREATTRALLDAARICGGLDGRIREPHHRR